MSLQFLDVGPGGPGDVCWHTGQILVARQVGQGQGVSVRVTAYDASLHPQWTLTYDCGDDAGTFPRVASDGSHWWLIYREGASLGGRAVLRRDGAVVWTSPQECGGNDPVCLGDDHFAWQVTGASNFVVLGRLTYPGTQRVTTAGRPTGLSHFDASGRVVLVDDARVSVPGITRPAWAGLLVCGEHPDAGVEVQYYDRRLRLWPTFDTFTPRISVDRGLYAVVTWNRDGVKLATFTLDDLSVPTPSIVPNPGPSVPNPGPGPQAPEGPVSMAIRDTLNALRANYGPTMSNDECVELINAAAWAHKSEGWGLSLKDFGTYGVRWDGVGCCHDVLMLKDGRYWDVLTSAGGASVPTFSDSPGGRITDPRRGWIAPIQPQAGTVPTPNPTPTPTPTPQPAACKWQPVDVEPFRLLVREELKALAVDVLATRAGVQDTRQDVLNLAARIEDINAEIHQMVQSQVAGLLAAIASRR